MVVDHQKNVEFKLSTRLFLQRYISNSITFKYFIFFSFFIGEYIRSLDSQPLWKNKYEAEFASQVFSYGTWTQYKYNIPSTQSLINLIPLEFDTSTSIDIVSLTKTLEYVVFLL